MRYKPSLDKDSIGLACISNIVLVDLRQYQTPIEHGIATAEVGIKQLLSLLASHSILCKCDGAIALDKAGADFIQCMYSSATSHLRIRYK